MVTGTTTGTAARTATAITPPMPTATTTPSPERLTTRSLLALGASAGIIPCPSALVVLLAAVAQHEVALGLLLIVAFSLGLAATLTGLGLLVVRASALLDRARGVGRAAVALPAVSALAIVVVGVVLTAVRGRAGDRVIRSRQLREGGFNRAASRAAPATRRDP